MCESHIATHAPCKTVDSVIHVPISTSSLSCWLVGGDWKRARHCWTWGKTLNSEQLHIHVLQILYSSICTQLCDAMHTEPLGCCEPTPFPRPSCPRVLQVALSSGCGECVPVYSPRGEKVAHRAAALAALANIWDHYGFRSQTSVPLCLYGMLTLVFFWNGRKCMLCVCAFCSHVSQLYCQLQGHVMSCDPPPTELEGRENCVISVSMTARHLLQMVGLHS